MKQHQTPDYGYASAAHSHAHAYLLPDVDAMLASLEPRRVFDLGCGNGSTAAHLSEKYEVIGVDASRSGIEQARAAYPHICFDVASAYDDLAGTYGQFDAVVSLEVVEHLYDPRLYAKTMFDLVRPGGGSWSPHLIMAIGRTSPSPRRARWISISLPCGTAGTSSSSRSPRSPPF